jgi:hypothetical protein
MLFLEIISPYSENPAKRIKITCQQNKQYFNRKTRGTFRYHCTVVLQVKVVLYKSDNISNASADAEEVTALQLSFQLLLKIRVLLRDRFSAKKRDYQFLLSNSL